MRILKWLIHSLLFFSSAFSQVGSKSLEEQNWLELSVSLVRAGAHLASACGPQFANAVGAAIEKKQSLLDLSQSVQRLGSQYPLCGQELMEYLRVSNESYARKNKNLIQLQKSSLDLFENSTALKNAKLEIKKGFDSLQNPNQVHVVEVKPGILLIEGSRPPGASNLAIKVTRPDDLSVNDFYQVGVLEKDQKNWSKKLYLRQGAGAYRIFVLSQVTENSYLVTDQLLTELPVSENPHLLPSDEVQSDDPEITELALKISKSAGTDFEKLKAIHDWVAENIVYDYYLLDKMNHGVDSSKVYKEPLSAKLTLKKKSGICQEYSYLTAALLRAIKIPARLVSGQTPNGKHAWNEAYADGRWIILDSTWDAGQVAGHNYFDPSLAKFSLDHTRENQLNY